MGPLPEEFYTLAKLREVDLVGCDISGTLSGNIGNLKNLRSFDIAYNNIGGPVPEELGTIPKLTWLDLEVHP